MTVSDMWPGHALEVDTKPGHGVPNQNICRQIGEPKDTIPGHEVDVDTIPGQRGERQPSGAGSGRRHDAGTEPSTLSAIAHARRFPGRLGLLRLCLVTFQILVLGQRETPEDDVVQKFLQRRPTTYRGVGGVHQLAHAVDDAAGHLGAGLMHRVLMRLQSHAGGIRVALELPQATVRRLPLECNLAGLARTLLVRFTHTTVAIGAGFGHRLITFGVGP